MSNKFLPEDVVREALQNAGGSATHATFIKLNGEVREMLAIQTALGVRGGERAYNPDEKKLTWVAERRRNAAGRFLPVEAGHRRSIPWDRVLKLTIRGQEVQA